MVKTKRIDTLYKYQNEEVKNLKGGEKRKNI